MGTALQRGPFSAVVRATYLLLQGRIHFPGDHLGKVIEAGGTFQVFRHMTLDPAKDQPNKPGAILKVRFRFATMSPDVNRKMSMIPTPFIVAQPGFRSKIWALDRKTGEFQGIYEWDTAALAENYWTSFPMKLMKRRAVPASLSYKIEEVVEDEY